MFQNHVPRNIFDGILFVIELIIIAVLFLILFLVNIIISPVVFIRAAGNWKKGKEIMKVESTMKAVSVAPPVERWGWRFGAWINGFFNDFFCWNKTECEDDQ